MLVSQMSVFGRSFSKSKIYLTAITNERIKRFILYATKTTHHEQLLEHQIENNLRFTQSMSVNTQEHLENQLQQIDSDIF
jgi:hypothetical protein